MTDETEPSSFVVERARAAIAHLDKQAAQQALLPPTICAVLSPCNRYRYELRRQNGVFGGRPKGRTVAWIMLNPSTADASEDDPTIRKVRGFSSRWGFEHVIVVNLFAWRATDPREMIEVASNYRARIAGRDGAYARCPDPVGPDNDQYIDRAAAEAELVVCGWGANARKADRLRVGAVLERLDRSKLHTLKLTAAGDPGHPLMLPYWLPLRSFP